MIGDLIYDVNLFDICPKIRNTKLYDEKSYKNLNLLDGKIGKRRVLPLFHIGFSFLTI